MNIQKRENIGFLISEKYSARWEIPGNLKADNSKYFVNVGILWKCPPEVFGGQIFYSSRLGINLLRLLRFRQISPTVHCRRSAHHRGS